MAMTRCKANLHFYNKDKHATCPYCEDMTASDRVSVRVEAAPSDPDDTCMAPTVAIDPQMLRPSSERETSVECHTAEGASTPQPSAPAPADQEFVQTVLAVGGMLPELKEEAAPAVASPEPAMEPELPGPPVLPDSEPRPAMQVSAGEAFNPVVGWLVSIDGPAKGRDYKIRSGMNEVAREEDPEVDLVIAGDPTISKRNHALIQYDPDDNGFYLIRLKNDAVKVNEAAVKRPIRLNAYDVLQLGSTRLVFVPLCSEKFQWDVP